jgi:1-acyl-sn-glycerol-3-phosphate acyltransferase
MEKKQQFNVTINMKIIKFIKEKERKYMLIFIALCIINLILFFTIFKYKLYYREQIKHIEYNDYKNF